MDAEKGTNREFAVVSSVAGGMQKRAWLIGAVGDRETVTGP